jgi:hypothetical protein
MVNSCLLHSRCTDSSRITSAHHLADLAQPAHPLMHAQTCKPVSFNRANSLAGHEERRERRRRREQEGQAPEADAAASAGTSAAFQIEPTPPLSDQVLHASC